ncbi:MAG: phospholipase C, phosphocholine-specific [Sphingomonadales bacterium]|nr:MAG: phospholipase C, phosphocholine-specific [Sphingomonadales bacterium]
MPSRRSFIRNGALLAGATGVLPASIQKALAITADSGTTYLDAEHIVILMQENRSFDHLLGTMRGVRGFADRRTWRQGGGVSVYIQRDKDGTTYAPWHASLKDTRFTWLGSVPHTRTSHLDAWNGGACNNWLRAKRSVKYPDIPMTLAYHTREDVPFYYALADAFTVCDQYFASGLTETTPNRLFLWSGNLREKHEYGTLPYLKNPSTHPGALNWTCFPERLERAGISWRMYQNDTWMESPIRTEPDFEWIGNSGDNTVERFRISKPKMTVEFRGYASGLLEGYKKSLRARKAALESGEAVPEKNGPHAGSAAKWIAAYEAQLKHLESKEHYGQADPETLSEAEKSFRSKVFTSNRNDPDFGKMETVTYIEDGVEKTLRVPASDIFYQLRKDVRENKLPTVSWLMTPWNFSAHPAVPFYGAWYISELMDILTENPEVWKKTIFLLTFDENDGFFDHVAPFVASDPQRPETGKASEGLDTTPEYAYKEEERLLGTPEALVRDGPIGLGFRVPMIVASPWSRGGWVNSQVSEHSSVIRFLEHFISAKFGKDVRQEEISEWRRAISGNLTSCFRPAEDKPDTLPFMERDPYLVDVAQAKSKPLPNDFSTIPAEAYRDAAAERALLGERLWQERGIKSSCALPYELSAQGRVSEDGTTFDIELGAGNARFGARAAGAPFILCLRGVRESSQTLDAAPDPAKLWVSHYAVKAGDVLTDRIALNRFETDRYEIEIFGPNGFYRNFTGNRSARAPSVACRPVFAKSGGATLEFALSHDGAKDVQLELRSGAYAAWHKRVTLRAGKAATVKFPLDPKMPWYEVSVTAPSDPAFRYTVAGRIEDGQPSISDPAIGFGATR